MIDSKIVKIASFTKNAGLKNDYNSEKAKKCVESCDFNILKKNEEKFGFEGFLFGFIFNYIIFSTIIYSVNNFEILFFLENWINENSYILKTLEEFNNNLINSIANDEVNISN